LINTPLPLSLPGTLGRGGDRTIIPTAGVAAVYVLIWIRHISIPHTVAPWCIVPIVPIPSVVASVLDILAPRRLSGSMALSLASVMSHGSLVLGGELLPMRLVIGVISHDRAGRT
jgi:hypothetical protein